MRLQLSRTIEVLFFAALFVIAFVFLARAFSESSQLAAPGLATPPPTPALTDAEKKVVERAKQYLREHAKEYSLRSDLADLRVLKVIISLGSDVVDFQQFYQGIPVDGVGVNVVIPHDPKQPIRVGSTYNSYVILRGVPPPYPGESIPSLTPKLSSKDAAARAVAALGAKGQLPAPATAELVLYPADKSGKYIQYALTWRIRQAVTDPLGDWGVGIDALTGEVLYKWNYFVPEPTGTGPTPLPYRSPSPETPTLTRIRPTPIIKIETDPNWKSPTLPPSPTRDLTPKPLPTALPDAIFTVSPSQIYGLPTRTPDPNRQAQPSPGPSAIPTMERIPIKVNPSPTTTGIRSPNAPTGCSLTMTENFEGAWPAGCWQTRGYPTWGTTDFMKHGGSKSAWCAEDGLNAYSDDHANNMNAWMIYGPFDLRGHPKTR